LQVGLESPHRVVLRDLPEIRRLLDDLRHGRASHPPTATAAAVLERLERADLLVTPPFAGLSSRPSVGLLGPRPLVEAAAASFRAAGLHVSEPGDVRVLLAHGALARTSADPLVRDGVPHVAAVATPWGWDLGPFVVPGETACLRCVDAAHSDHDPRYGVVLDQLVRSAAAAPIGPALSTIAMGWLARDLIAYDRGERPSTWSATVRLTEVPGPELLDERRWLRHPHCGCAWDALTG